MGIRPRKQGLRVLVVTPEAAAAREAAKILRGSGHRPAAARTPARALAAMVEASRGGDSFSSVLVFEAGLPVSSAAFASLVRAESLTRAARLVLVGPRGSPSGSQSPPPGYAASAGTVSEAVQAVVEAGASRRPQSRPRPRAARAVGKRTALRRMCVLVGEEDDAERAALRIVAEAGGHEVLECADGEQALDALESGRVDVGIIGSQLGTLTGEDVAAIHRYNCLGGARVPLLGIAEGCAAPAESGFPFDGVVPRRAEPDVLLAALLAASKSSPAHRRSRPRPASRARLFSGIPGQVRR